MASKHSNQKKYAKAKFDSHQVTLTPYPPLSKIYNCYAQIIRGSKIAFNYQPDIKLLCLSKISENEFFVLDNFCFYILPNSKVCHQCKLYCAPTLIYLRLKYQLRNLFKLIMSLKLISNY
jgi:hypothetical protein